MHSFQDHSDDHHGDIENGNKCPIEDSFKTIHQKSGKSVLSRQSTKMCQKWTQIWFFQGPSSPQNVQQKGFFQEPLRMDPKMTLLSRPWVKKAKNQLLSRPLQIELKTLTPNTWSLVDEVSQGISDPKSRKKAQPVIEQPSSSPPPPGSRFNPIYVEPGSVSIDSTRDLQALFPNSFDCIGDMQGEYDIKTDLNRPTSPTWKTESSH